MRLDREICLGGRLNGMIVRGIKYNKHVIYPSTYSKYNVYEVVIPQNNYTIYLDTTNRTGESYTPFYDFGDGVVNPTVGSETMSGLDLETGETVDETYATYTYTTAGAYQIRTTEALYYLRQPLESVILLSSDLKDASYFLWNHDKLTEFKSNQKDSLDKITNMKSMFGSCESLTTVDFSDFYLPNVTNMDGMFHSCTNLKTVNFSNSYLPKVESMNNIFTDCDSLELANFSNCNLSKLISLDIAPSSRDAVFRFDGCNFSSLTSFLSVNYGAKSFSFSNCKFDSLTSCESAFGNLSIEAIDFSNADMSNVTNMRWMFSNCTSLTTVNMDNVDTSNVTNMYSMFYYCKKLTELDLSGFNTSNVTNMYGMFSGCSSLISLNISNFDISDTTNTFCLFENCNNLHTLRLDNCNNTTINAIITSRYFPTNTIEGTTRKIYCKQENATGLTPPENWVFEYID